MKFCSPPDESVFPIMVFANKSDLVDEVKISADDIAKWCEENHGVPFAMTSAKENEGVEDGFQKLIEKAVKTAAHQKPKPKPACFALP